MSSVEKSYTAQRLLYGLTTGADRIVSPRLCVIHYIKINKCFSGDLRWNGRPA
jgi:hypothetical protein